MDHLAVVVLLLAAWYSVASNSAVTIIPLVLLARRYGSICTASTNR